MKILLLFPLYSLIWSQIEVGSENTLDVMTWNLKAFPINGTATVDYIDENGKLMWSSLLETVNHDELVYKLTLKYLRRDGYDIGNRDNPEIKKL